MTETGPVGERREVSDVVVVGSGPNGMAAAVTMARAGLGVVVLEAQPTIGGGARTAELGLAPGIRHDLCSAVHPLATSSPFFRAFDLRARGVELTAPEVSYGQPLDGGRAALAYRDLERTAAGLGADGDAWRSLLGPLVRDIDAVLGISLGDMRSIPGPVRSPRGLRGATAFGLRLLEQGTRCWNHRFSGDAAPALLTGVAAHAIAPVPTLAAAGTALMLGALAHHGGWTVPVGGSQAISDALAADLLAHGGEIRTGHRVSHWHQLPRARAYLLDTAPGAAAGIWADQLPADVHRALRRHRHGDAAAKVDFVLRGPVPWAAPELAQAATVHVGGTRADMARAEHDVARGRHPDQPVVLVSDPTLTDPGRGRDGLRPLWAYAHVPAGSTRDMTEAVTARIEHFAPGFRDVVVAARGVPAARLAETNESYVGGDIAGGAVTMARMLTGSTGRLDPYRLGIPGVYLCSASAPPAPGVHGMSGWHAARRALRDRFGRRPPSLAP